MSVHCRIDHSEWQNGELLNDEGYGDILRRLICGNPGRYRALCAAKKIETNQGFDKNKSERNSKG